MINLERRKTAELIPYANNARINDAAVSAVANSIHDFGMNNPILIDEKNVIIAGHARLRALQKLGIEETPVIVVSGISEEQVKAYRIADNSTAQLAEWDLDKLQAELDSIDFKMEQYGLQKQLDEIQRQMDAALAAEIEEDEIPEVDEASEPKTKAGDIWLLGRHRLMCGDSRNLEEVERLVNGVKADMFLTDPPYNVDYEGKTKNGLKIENDNLSEEDFMELLVSSFGAADKVLKSGAAFYIWHPDSGGLNFRLACKNTGWKIRQCLIWVKNSLILGWQDYQWRHEPCLYGNKVGDRYFAEEDYRQDHDPCLYGWTEGAKHYFIDDRKKSTVIEYNKPLKNGDHPTMKPVGVLAKQVANSSRGDEVVLDLFGGSGSTMIACEKLNRICYMMELDPKYCDVIVKRWENLTGRKAEKVAG